MPGLYIVDVAGIQIMLRASIVSGALVLADERGNSFVTSQIKQIIGRIVGRYSTM
jgi:hypothetical protein